MKNVWELFKEGVVLSSKEFEGYIIAVSFESKPLYTENFTPPTEPYGKEESKRKEKDNGYL